MLLLEFCISVLHVIAKLCVALLCVSTTIDVSFVCISDGQATVIGECISDWVSNQGSDSLSFLLSLDCLAFFGQCDCKYINVEMRTPVGLLWKCLHYQLSFATSISLCVASSLQATRAVAKVDGLPRAPSEDVL